MDEPKYRKKGFLARSLALYSAARLATRMTAREGEAAIRPIESIASIRRVDAVTPNNFDDPDVNALA